MEKANLVDENEYLQEEIEIIKKKNQKVFF